MAEMVNKLVLSRYAFLTPFLVPPEAVVSWHERVEPDEWHMFYSRHTWRRRMA